MTNAYARAFRAYIRRTGTSQSKLARHIGCSQTIISQYVAGDRFPKREMAKLISAKTRGQIGLEAWKAAAIARALA